jgi:hypothetical protein
VPVDHPIKGSAIYAFVTLMEVSLDVCAFDAGAFSRSLIQLTCGSHRKGQVGLITASCLCTRAMLLAFGYVSAHLSNRATATPHVRE